jgi:hypothetical protein
MPTLIKPTYDTHVLPYMTRFTKINIEQSKIDLIKELVKNVVKEKAKEYHHVVDGKKEEKRFFTGFIGEAAIENLLGIAIIDWRVGVSQKFFIPDLSGHNVNIGIKTVEWGKFPIIFKSSHGPEIINIKLSDTEVLVCGFASVKCLRLYQSDDLILSPLLKAKGTKTGFFGFNELKQFRTLDELKLLV